MGTDKRDRQRANKAAKQQQAARAETKKKGTRYGLIIGGAIVGVVGLVFIANSVLGGDDDESPTGDSVPEVEAEAAEGEVFEETGWCITQPQVFFRFKVFSFMPDYDLWAEKVCTIYAARPVYRKSAPTEPDHYSVILPIEAALSHLASDGDRQAVAQFFGAA